MILEANSLIEDFLNCANHKLATSNKKFFLPTQDNHTQSDILLGISMTTIKEHIKNLPIFPVDILVGLVSSEYNEARILGWALFARDYPQSDLLYDFARKNAAHCGNWNVVDFAAPITSRILFKNEGRILVHKLGYKLLFSNTNIWTQRFSLLLALPLIKNNDFNYAMDVVGRSLGSNEELIDRACGVILKEVGKKDIELLQIFIKNNYQNIPPSIHKYLSLSQK